MLSDADERLHEWPRDCDTTWKENYYWNLADRVAGVWGFSHVSLVRTSGRGLFTAVYMIDGRVRMHRGEIAVGDADIELGDGVLLVEIVEPHRLHRLCIDTAEYRLDAEYEARFAPFSYGGRKISANASRIEHLRLKRYEQGMRVKGRCLSKPTGRVVEIDCLGHRDHSWGRREESKIDGWNWAAVQLENKTINVTRSFAGDHVNVNGFISTAEGNLGVRDVEFETLEFDGDGRTPLATRYRFEDDEGRTWHLRSRRFSDLFEALKSTRDQAKTIIYENFADYVLEETGETGWGIDEYQRSYRT
jgi:hypothetical protein